MACRTRRGKSGSGFQGLQGAFALWWGFKIGQITQTPETTVRNFQYTFFCSRFAELHQFFSEIPTFFWQKKSSTLPHDALPQYLNLNLKGFPPFYAIHCSPDLSLGEFYMEFMLWG